jgi:PAS domain S-box-containing protein
MYLAPAASTQTGQAVSGQGPSAEHRLRQLVEALPTALILADRAGLIVMVNRQTEKLFGHGRAALMGKKLEALLPERFRAGHEALRNVFLKNMSSRQMGEGRELFGLRADGSEFPLEIGLTPIDLEGEAMVLAGIVDATARRQAELANEHRQRELERSNADLDEFAHIAAHDQKAPLRALGHLADWIREDVEATAGPETLENLALVKIRVARLQTLLDGLLAYSRAGLGKKTIEDIDVEALVGEIATLLAPPPGFSIQCAGQMGSLRTHRAALRVVFENLIGNAINHHDRDQGQITISMNCCGDLTEFRVADDGPGIAPRAHERIFLIFQTLAGTGETSGIGLAIAKKQVALHGGTIHVESAPPARGATFVFTWQEALL